MPQSPLLDFGGTPGTEPIDLPRKTVPLMRGDETSLAPGLKSAAKAVDWKLQQAGANKSANDAADLRMRNADRERQLQQEAQKDPVHGADNYTGKLMDAFEKDFKNTLKSYDGFFSTGYGKQALLNMYPTMREETYQRGLEFEAKFNVASRTHTTLKAGTKAAASVQVNPDTWQQAGAEQMAALNAQGLPPERRLALSQHIDGEISEAAGTGYAKSDPYGTLERLKDPSDALFSGMTPDARTRVEQLARGTLVQKTGDGIVDTYRQLGPQKGAQAFASIDKSDISPDLKDAIRTHVQRGLAQREAEARQQFAPQLMSVEERIASGQPAPGDRAQILDLYRKGAFNPPEAAAKLGSIDRAELAAIPDESGKLYVAKAYANNYALDPKDADIKKWTAALFTDKTKGLQPGTAAWINLGADIAQKTGVTPEPVVSWSRAQLTAGPPQNAAIAAQAIIRMTESNPRGTPYALDEKEKVMARQIYDMTIAGTPADVAVATARKIESLPDGEREKLGEVYRKMQFASLSDSSLRSLLKDDKRYDTGIFTQVPQFPDGMVGEYEQLRRDYYKANGGNIDQASKLAADDLKRTWGITRLNGKPEFMQFAPEAMNPGLSTSAIRSDMEQAVTGLTPDPSKVRLVPDPQYTHVTEGRAWLLGVPGKFDAYDIVRGKDNNPRQYVLPDPARAMLAEKQRQDAAGMAAARESQARIRAGQASLTEDVKAFEMGRLH